MRNKIFAGIAILLIALFFLVRHLYNRGFEEFKTSVASHESSELKKFNEAKQNKIDLLSKGDQKIYQLFANQFDDSKSVVERDTTFSFLYLSGTIKYQARQMGYINCLNNKCITDENNAANIAKISLKERVLENKFGETFLQWYPKLKEEKLAKKTKQINECNFFFPELFEVQYDERTWNDFSSFMSAYNTENRDASIQNKRFENEFSSNVTNTTGQLNSGVIDYFNNQLENRRSQILTQQPEQRSYSSPVLGLISYSINKVQFNKEAFQSMADDVFEEQWRSNSLSTGSMPYSYCYGGSNYCDDYGCSKISVITGGANDVLVTIKNSNGNVVRHGYINGGSSFTFSVPDGRYQVFFYSGNGWNPNKFMTTTTCGDLRGGFVSSENFTKDNYISIYNQVMTYELILQQDGNLSTQPSSMSEAFN